MSKLDKLSNKEELLAMDFAKSYIAEYTEYLCTQEEAENYLYDIIKGEGCIFSKKVGEKEAPRNEWSENDWEHFGLNGSVPTIPVIQEYFKDPKIN